MYPTISIGNRPSLCGAWCMDGSVWAFSRQSHSGRSWPSGPPSPTPDSSPTRLTGFAILATAVREVLDAFSMRLTMRILRTNDMNATQRTVAAIICPAIGGALAAMVFVPHALTHLTLLTWALFMLITCTLEQPWKKPLSYEEMRERGRRTRLMTRDHFAEEIADGRMTFRPIDNEGYYLDEDGNRIDD